MNNYILSCCSTVDLNVEKLAKRNISWKSFYFFLNGKEYLDDMFSHSITASDFYNRMIDGDDTRTSQINTNEYFNYFESLLETYDEIVHATLSSGLSGSYNSAKIAVDIIKEKYPNKNVYLIDSLGASSGLGLFVDLLADKRDEGATAKELFEYGEKLKLNIRHDFYSTDLTFYIKGGRVSKVAGFIGGILKICPVLDMNNEGKLIPRKKARGKIKAAEELIANMTACAINGRDYDGKCFISHSDCLQEAERLKRLLEEQFDNLKGQIEIFSIGPTIGSHSGPGTIALFYVGSERTE